MGRPAVATSRFATAGCFTAEQLEKGADLEAIQESQASDGPDFDPDDKRSLYERLMEQKDAKQAEWEHRHTFKNQMDHWRLDEDEAAFEEERLAKLKAQQDRPGSAACPQLQASGTLPEPVAHRARGADASSGGRGAFPGSVLPLRRISDELSRKLTSD